MLPTSFRGDNNYDSPQMVLCNVTQLFARSKSVTLGCHPFQGRGPKTQVDQKGADESFDSVQDTNLTLQSANMESTSLCNLWISCPEVTRKFQFFSIALFIARQSSSRPRPLLAE